MLLTIENCTTALSAAAINYKAAIQLEMATGLVVFHAHGGSNRDARTMLVAAYAATGWRCTKLGESDYKTVNRRVNATAALYEKVPVAKWVGQLGGMDAIEAVCEGLRPYELYTIQDVLRYAAPGRVHQPRKLSVAPRHDILAGPVTNATSGHDKVLQQFRRASDQAEQGGRQITTEHLSLVVPKDVPREELIELAMQIMALAKNNDNQLLTA